jgi:hypothetical protein
MGFVVVHFIQLHKNVLIARLLAVAYVVAVVQAQAQAHLALASILTQSIHFGVSNN